MTAPATTPSGPTVAYITSRFPKLSETFVLYELEAVERAGAQVVFFPLLRERTDVMHPEARRWVEQAWYSPFLDRRIVAANLRALWRTPGRYLRTLAAVLVGTWGNVNFFVSGIGLFPKVVATSARLQAAGVHHVHCHFATHPALAGFVIRRMTGIPYSFTAHGSDLHVARHMLPQKVREAAFVVAISEFNRQVILDECAPHLRTAAERAALADRVVVVHCGVDTTAIAPSDAAARAHAGGATADRAIDAGAALRLLCIGTLHEVKGQRYLIEACRRLVERDVPVELRIVGGGPDHDELQRLVDQLGLTTSVQLVGSLTRPEIIDELRRAQVLVAPSVPTKQGKREGIPVVLMEGMAAGLAVVASRLSGIPELVEDEVSGLLVEPRDVDGIAGALERLAGDGELVARLGAGARARVLAEFDLDRNAALLVRRFAGGDA